MKTATATAMIIDLRNFTHNLCISKNRTVFSKFLEEFLNICFRCIRVGCNAVDGMEDPNVYVNSTGDGFLAVFHSEEEHAREAFISSVLLLNKLDPHCKKYNHDKNLTERKEKISFGIGIDSGEVFEIKTNDTDKYLFIKTFLGNTINIAKRVQDKTKDFKETMMTLTQNTNEILCLGYNQLISEEKKGEMDKLNKKLFIEYIYWHYVKGVEDPVCLYRLSNSLASPKHDDFWKNIEKMSKNKKHFERIKEFLQQ